MTSYDVKCPKCGAHALAQMRADGMAGTYREPLIKLVAERVTCTHCGFNATSDEPLTYELWYKASVRGRVAWAHNRRHAAVLVDYLSNRMPDREVDPVAVETLPGWMLEPKNRRLVSEKLQRLLEDR